MIVALCDLNIARLEAVYAQLAELDDSEMVTRIGADLEVSVADMMHGVMALLGAVREELAAAC